MYRTTLLTAILTLAASTAAIAQGPAPATPASPPQQDVKAAPITPTEPSTARHLRRKMSTRGSMATCRTRLHTGDIAGAVVAVVKDGQIVTERGYGYSDVENAKPVDPKLTLFRPGSVSKLFTWTAVMQLVEQGKIDLDADINKYLDFQIPPRDGKPITMRNLMQHTAGFEEQVKDIISEDPNGPGFEELVKRWTPTRVFDAGTTPAYSNYGASLAGYIVSASPASRSTTTSTSTSSRHST